jgi:serine/threonine-protein kinase RsbW
MNDRRRSEPEYGLTFVASLPLHPRGIRTVRHIARSALRELGVDRQTVGDLELALTEACANALEHASPGQAYGVKMSIDAQRCEFDIVDFGSGFEETASARPPGEVAAAESGRGLRLMRALVDRVEVTSGPGSGTHVHLSKDLVFDDAVARDVLSKPAGRRAAAPESRHGHRSVGGGPRRSASFVWGFPLPYESAS